MSNSAGEPSIRHSAGRVSLQRFADVVASLRAPDGCPWDRAQTHQTLRKYALEETYELADAIDADDPAAMREELGDVLLQVVLHSQLASERGDFGLQDVIDGITDKMLRRHPHVFGDERAADAAEVEAQWKEAKRREGRTVLGGVPKAMPAVERAWRISERAAKVGFDFPTAADAFDKLVEEVEELRVAVDGGDADATVGELGDVMFACVNLARKLSIDAAAALRRTLAKFEDRFGFIEARLGEQGTTVDEATLEQMDAIWDEAKALGR